MCGLPRPRKGPSHAQRDSAAHGIRAGMDSADAARRDPRNRRGVFAQESTRSRRLHGIAGCGYAPIDISREAWRGTAKNRRKLYLWWQYRGLVGDLTRDRVEREPRLGGLRPDHWIPDPAGDFSLTPRTSYPGSGFRSVPVCPRLGVWVARSSGLPRPK